MKKILIVDDHEQIRTTLRQHLLEAGYDVLETNESKQALELITRELPELVVLEAMIPEMNGFQLCQHLQGTPQSDLVYVIMLTALPGIEQKLREDIKGADAYLIKPLNGRGLGFMVFDILDEKFAELSEEDWQNLMVLTETYRVLHRISLESGRPLWLE